MGREGTLQEFLSNAFPQESMQTILLRMAGKVFSLVVDSAAEMESEPPQQH